LFRKKPVRKAVTETYQSSDAFLWIR